MSESLERVYTRQHGGGHLVVIYSLEYMSHDRVKGMMTHHHNRRSFGEDLRVMRALGRSKDPSDRGLFTSTYRFPKAFGEKGFLRNTIKPPSISSSRKRAVRQDATEEDF